MVKLDPQPIIRGSFIQDGDKVHYCEKDDIDRICGPIPIWHTIICPYGAEGCLTQIDNIWYWNRQE